MVKSRQDKSRQDEINRYFQPLWNQLAEGRSPEGRDNLNALRAYMEPHTLGTVISEIFVRVGVLLVGLVDTRDKLEEERTKRAALEERLKKLEGDLALLEAAVFAAIRKKAS